MAGLILLAGFVALGIASVLGITADSRDPEYGLGRLLRDRNR
jgi:hypothetical protein